jgi:hypothetical protein
MEGWPDVSGFGGRMRRNVHHFKRRTEKTLDSAHFKKNIETVYKPRDKAPVCDTFNTSVRIILVRFPVLHRYHPSYPS